jgi:hypothetical protein
MLVNYLFTSYCGFISAALALESFILVFIMLFVRHWGPEFMPVECPEPNPAKNRSTKVAYPPTYPPEQSIQFLISVYILDILVLYPYTKEGSTMDLHWTFLPAGILVGILQARSAIRWGRAEVIWKNISRRLALWNSRPWCWYYWSFIITSIGVVVPLLFQGIWMAHKIGIQIAPVLWGALCNAYSPFIVL